MTESDSYQNLLIRGFIAVVGVLWGALSFNTLVLGQRDLVYSEREWFHLFQAVSGFLILFAIFLPRPFLRKKYIAPFIVLSTIYIEYGMTRVIYANLLRAYRLQTSVDMGIELVPERISGRMIEFGLTAFVFAFIGILFALAWVRLLFKRKVRSER